MEFLKKHYEKILLSIVLLGLVGAILWLLTAIKDAEADSQMGASAPPKIKVLPDLNLSAERQAIQAVANPQPVVLSGSHNVFNPVTWKRKPDGSLMKILVEGPEALTITGIKPVLMTISYDHPGGPGFYIMNIQSQTGKRYAQEYAKVNELVKSGIFTIREVKGAAEDPTELVLELAGTKEMVSVSKSNSYQRVEIYTADLKYDPESKPFSKLRVNDPLTISGLTYRISSISSNEVRVIYQPTGKQTTIIRTGSPKP